MSTTAAQHAQNLTKNIPDPRVVDIIREAWSAESAKAGYDPERPESGQGAVSALSIQDFFGGVIKHATINGVSHYWNVMDDGAVIDLTRAQFDEPLDIQGEKEVERNEMMSDRELRARYNRFDERVSELV